MKALINISTCRALAIRPKEHAVLHAYSFCCKEKATAARAAFEVRREHANFVIWRELAKHADLQDKIDEVTTRIRIRQKGEALTEAYDDDQPLLQMNDGDRFLLKKAWRKVAALVHPDTVGGDADLFDFMRKAYLAGDLRTLTEYVISQEKTLMDQIAYWMTEMQRPDINWQILQRMDQFQMLRALMSGQKELASKIARTILSNQLIQLELEELSLTS